VMALARQWRSVRMRARWRCRDRVEAVPNPRWIAARSPWLLSLCERNREIGVLDAFNAVASGVPWPCWPARFWSPDAAELAGSERRQW
jgi:hypothetical protein